MDISIIERFSSEVSTSSTDTVEELRRAETFLSGLFDELCHECPGVIVVRRSYGVFRRLLRQDWETFKSQQPSTSTSAIVDNRPTSSSHPTTQPKVMIPSNDAVSPELAGNPSVQHSLPSPPPPPPRRDEDDPANPHPQIPNVITFSRRRRTHRNAATSKADNRNDGKENPDTPRATETTHRFPAFMTHGIWNGNSVRLFFSFFPFLFLSMKGFSDRSSRLSRKS